MSAAETANADASPQAEDVRRDVDQLYRVHGGWLLAFLRRRFGADAAEDLAQETFARSLGARSEIRSPRAFLMRIALNTAQNQRRAQASRPRLEPEGPRTASAATPSDQAEALALKQVILGLPPKLRDVFLLSRVKGLTYEEIAQRLEISVKTVEWRMTRALAICAARMRD